MLICSGICVCRDGMLAGQIVEHIKNRDAGWTAQTVLRAYIRRAIRAHQETNCITEGSLRICQGASVTGSHTCSSHVRIRYERGKSA